MSYLTVLLSVMAVHVVAMISPGPNFLIVTQTAISHSRREGVLTAFGVSCAALLWSSAALLGISLLFETTVWLYQGLKVLGGAYLIYLGIQSWRYAGRPPQLSAKTPPGSNWRLFRVGFVTNLTNPKSAIFFSSIFATLLPAQLPVWVRVAAVGVIVFDALWWHVALAFTFSTRPAQQLYIKAKRSINLFTGTFLVFIGARLMLSK